MKGTLSDQPLAELIREISSRGFSGTLRLEHDRVQAAVYFEKGRLVFAASNLRSLRLQSYLIKQSFASEKEISKFSAKLSDLDLAAALCGAGMIKRQQIDYLLATMVADVLRVALLWTVGTWDFDERARLGHDFQVTIDIHTLLREAGQRLPLKFVSDRFRNPSEIISRGADAAGKGNNLLPGESFLMSRLDSPMKLQDLVALSGMRELDANRLIYGLALSGMVTREYWHHAFRAETAPPAKDSAAAGEANPPVSDETAAAEEAANELAALELFLERVSSAADHYEVLDIARTADADQIKVAYYALARRYHPDRFHLQSGTSQHARISSAFAQVTQAYETLTDPQARVTYDAGLERAQKFASTTKAGPVSTSRNMPQGTASPQLEEADEYFREGVAALAAGDLQLAVSQLAAAARMFPREARYRAHYGAALAAGEQTRRLAENELQAAIKLDPTSAVYRTMLAELYFKLNFHRRAQTEVQRALVIDAKNPRARALLRKLASARRTG